MKKPSLVVYGLSGNTLEALETIEQQFEIVAFLDDAPDRPDSFAGVSVLPSSEHDRFPEAQVICLIGSESNHHRRHRIVESLRLPRERFASVIHPGAWVSRNCMMGRGTMIFAGTALSPMTEIGDHVIILPQSVVHHDARVGAFTLIGSQVVIAGAAVIGDGCYIGSGSTIRNGVTIGDGCLIGMGSNVLRDVEPGSVVAGNPARFLRQR